MKTAFVILYLSVVSILAGCSNQQAARVGHHLGHFLGKPLGAIATTANAAWRTSGEIIKEDLREYHERRDEQPQEENQLMARSDPASATQPREQVSEPSSPE